MYIAKRRARNESLDSYMGSRGQVSHEYNNVADQSWIQSHLLHRDDNSVFVGCTLYMSKLCMFSCFFVVSLLIHKKKTVEMEQKGRHSDTNIIAGIHKVEPMMDLSDLLSLRLWHNAKFLYYLELYWGKHCRNWYSKQSTIHRSVGKHFPSSREKHISARKICALVLRLSET